MIKLTTPLNPQIDTNRMTVTFNYSDAKRHIIGITDAEKSVIVYETQVDRGPVGGQICIPILELQHQMVYLKGTYTLRLKALPGTKEAEKNASDEVSIPFEMEGQFLSNANARLAVKMGEECAARIANLQGNLEKLGGYCDEKLKYIPEIVQLLKDAKTLSESNKTEGGDLKKLKTQFDDLLRQTNNIITDETKKQTSNTAKSKAELEHAITLKNEAVKAATELRTLIDNMKKEHENNIRTERVNPAVARTKQHQPTLEEKFRHIDELRTKYMENGNKPVKSHAKQWILLIAFIAMLLAGLGLVTLFLFGGMKILCKVSSNQNNVPVFVPPPASVAAPVPAPVLASTCGPIAAAVTANDQNGDVDECLPTPGKEYNANPPEFVIYPDKTYSYHIQKRWKIVVDYDPTMVDKEPIGLEAAYTAVNLNFEKGFTLRLRPGAPPQTIQFHLTYMPPLKH